MNPLRTVWRKGLKLLLNLTGLTVMSYRHHTMIRDRRLIRRLNDIRIEGRALQSLEELINIAGMAKVTEGLGGDVAELGVYRGGTARVIAENKGSRLFHVFDSFSGMATAGQDDLHQTGDFGNTSLEDVREYLREFEGIHFHEGWFPTTTRGLESARFSFVHLDADLYESTIEALKFFYPRIIPGGILLSHDYNTVSCPGVAKAFREYFSPGRSLILELGGTTQCLVVKQ